MKYKVLIAGKNNSVIDSFFAQMDNEFEAMTTSNRYDDIDRHLNYFKPDAFVFGIYNESRESVNQIINARYRLADAHVPVILVGSKEECDEVEKLAANLASLTLYRPLAASRIAEEITRFLDRRRAGAADDNRQEKEAAKKAQDRKSTADALNASGLITASRKDDTLRRHVLVVDDNSMMLKLIKEYLHDDYDVATAVSGTIALKFLERRTTDLILLDYEMPGQNGPAVLEQLRASDTTRNIPVVFLTGVTETKRIQEALRLKPQSYLLKPVDRGKLLSTIAKLIG
ncbi:MAG: response regulator [Lachnospiraceae bacterium]|nr:response regulator [Lachnospiraceae bacterium]